MSLDLSKFTMSGSRKTVPASRINGVEGTIVESPPYPPHTVICSHKRLEPNPVRGIMSPSAAIAQVLPP